MFSDVIIALISALVGTYFGTYFLARREESKQFKIRNIAIKALEIVKEYAKYSGTYDMASAEINAKLSVAEKRSVIVALHKLGLPIQMPFHSRFDVKDLKLNKDIIDLDILDDAILQINRGYCDCLFYEDPDKYFTENLRIYTLRDLAKRFVNEVLRDSKYICSEEIVRYPDRWLDAFTFGEKKAIWVFKCQVTSSIYFCSDGSANTKELDKLSIEIDTGLWDNYLLWVAEAYDNISLGTNLTNRVLQSIKSSE